MKISKVDKQVLRIELDIGKSFEQWFLLTADRHWDNPKSDWDLQIKHLEEAKEKNAYVIDFGDFFCAMQGKYDKRSSKSDLRPEHQHGDYLDKLVTTATEFIEPYADRFIQISPGNHCASVYKRHETDLIERLTTLINYKTGHKIHKGTYAGWIQFAFKRNEERRVVLLHYTHGYGGGGEVTKGVIQAQRRAVYLPDANICVSGHIHEAWQMVIPRERISSRGKPYLDNQIHISLPTYKEEYLPGEGWHIETGKPPKPLGAWWVKFTYNSKHEKIDYDFIRAQ